MVIKKKIIKREKEISFLNSIQYIISIIIALLFILGLIPYTFKELFPILISLIIIQFFISIIRLRILNIFLELILILLSIFSIIPILGYFFRILGFLTAIIEIITFKNSIYYKKIEIITINKFSNKKQKKRPTNNKIIDIKENN
jgi:hypothetical protein